MRTHLATRTGVVCPTRGEVATATTTDPGQVTCKRCSSRLAGLVEQGYREAQDRALEARRLRAVDAVGQGDAYRRLIAQDTPTSRCLALITAAQALAVVESGGEL